MERINYSSGAKWEDVVGYSRAVRMGNMIEITGTVAVDENDQIVGGNDAYAQTRYIIQKIEKVLKRAGAGPLFYFILYFSFLNCLPLHV